MSASAEPSPYESNSEENTKRCDSTEVNYTNFAAATASKEELMECKLCLSVYPQDFFYKLKLCGCFACEQCMTDYVESGLTQDRVLQMVCPVNRCQNSNLTHDEIRHLLDETSFARYLELRYLKEVEADPSKMFCPRPGCENVCQLINNPPEEYERKILSRTALPVEAWQIRRVPTSIACSMCHFEFCSVCKTVWHEDLSCQDANAKLKPEERSVLYCTPMSSCGHKSAESKILLKTEDDANEDPDSDDALVFKPCPVCALPIERDLGCAKIECIRCNHTFCWHCSELLDEDFMWLHYEEGPCKDKLGMPRAQVHTYRITAVLTMAGIGLLLLIASPAIIIAAPCLLCYKFGPKEKDAVNDRLPETSTSSLSAPTEEKVTMEKTAEANQPKLQSGLQSEASPNKNKSCPKNTDKSDSIFAFCRFL